MKKPVFEKKDRIMLPVCWGIFFTVLCFSMHFYLRLSDIVSINPVKVMKVILQGFSFPLAAVCLVLSGIVVFFVRFYRKEAADFLYKYRYAVAAALFILAVIFKINGSSAGAYSLYFSSESADNVLFGRFRPERTDEYAVLTPIMLSQYFGSSPFSWFSEIVRAAHTDVFLEYGAPVRNLAVLFRPFHWGFLFLSPERGFSFWWCGRLIALFMASFETAFLFSRKNRVTAVLYALLLCFSPTVSWWFGVNSLVEMLVFGHLFIFMFYKLIRDERPFMTVICVIVLAISGGAYIFTVYPARQMPLGYYFLLLIIYVLKHNKKYLKQSRIWIALSISIALMAGLTAYILVRSGTTLRAIINTEYPGNAELVSGQGFALFFCGGADLFSPYTNLVQTCEQAVMFCLAPFGLLLSVYYLIRTGKRDLTLLLAAAIEIMFLLSLSIPFNETVNKIFFFGFFNGPRTAQVVGIFEIFLLIRSAALLRQLPDEKKSFLPAVFLLPLIAALMNGYFIGKEMPVFKEYKAVYLAAVILPALLSMFLCIYAIGTGKRARSGKNAAAVLLYAMLLLFFAGGMVNPVCSGLDAPLSYKLTEEIRTIAAEDPEGAWIVETNDDDLPLANLPILAGAPCINSVNIYPNFERWERLDPEGAKRSVYNRYAHIDMTLTEGETDFEVGVTRDRITLRLSEADFGKFGVKYFITRKDDLEVPGGSLMRRASDGEFTIYEYRTGK